MSDVTLEQITENRQSLLGELKSRQAVARDFVRGVAGRDYPGFYLFGAPGTAKTFTVKTLLEHEFPDQFVFQAGHITPMGLFGLIKDCPDKTIVLDDVGAIFENKVALQLLLSALEHSSAPDRGRTVIYRRQKEEKRVRFRGGIVCISNLELHDKELLGALKSRVQVLNYNPSNAQLGVLILDLASKGWPFGSARPSVSPREATEVAEFVIGEMVRFGCRFDLRLFAAKGLPVYRQWKNGGTESHWRDLVRATVEEQLIAAQEGADPSNRAARLENDRAILGGIMRQYPSRGEQLRAWREQTGRSQRSYYRRRGEVE